MATARIYLRTDQPLASGECPIMMRLLKDRKKREMVLKYKCHPSLWDDKVNKPKRKHPMYHELMDYLTEKEREVNKVILALNGENKPFTVEDIFNKLSLSIKVNKTTVFSYLEEHIQKLASESSISYSHIFIEVLRQLRKFRNGKDFSFYDLTPQFIARFEEWILKRGVKYSTAHIYLRTLKTAVNKAKKDGVVVDSFAPFASISFKKYNKYKPQKRALSKNAIDSIKQYSTEKNSKHEFAKDVFLFSYYCRGMNFTDMAYLKWSDLVNGQLNYERRKTKKDYSMELLEGAKAILSKYRKVYEGEDSYVFPILSKSHVTAKQQDYRIEKMLKQVNKTFREISDNLKFPSAFTFYSARHTFATVSFHNGVPVAFITEALGHDTEKTTRDYLKEFDGDVMKSAFEEVL